MEACEVKVCRICLATDCHLHHLYENINLYRGYEALTGLKLADEEDLPPYLCTNCADQLMSCTRFRHRSLQAHLTLLDILKNHDRISVESIQAVIKTTQCDTVTDPVERDRVFDVIKIEVQPEDIPDTTRLHDEMKSECKPDVGADEDLVEDKGVITPCVVETNYVIVKEEVVDDAGDAGSLDDGLPSEQDGEVETVGARQGTEVPTDFEQREASPQGAEVNEQIKLRHVPNGDKPYTCGVCQKSFSRKSTLNIHLLTHADGKPHSCYVCKMSFYGKTDLQRHVLVHSGEKPFTCDLCKKSFRLKSTLQTHMLTHSADKPYSCGLCKMSFCRKIALKRHMLIHSGEKPFSCEVCSKSFRLKGTLTSHKRIHSGEKPHTCEVCDKSFRERGDLQRHMRIHSGDKPHSCAVCNKSFCLNFTLQRHMVVHSAERPYTCDVCEKSLRSKSDLVNHMLRHSGNKPHSCDTCVKSFHSKLDLDRHRRTHSGVTFPCNSCVKSFRSKRQLQFHMTRVHSVSSQ